MCNLYLQGVAPSINTHFFRDTPLHLSEKARGRNIEAGYVGADQDGPVLVNIGDSAFDLVDKRWGFPAIRNGAKPLQTFQTSNHHGRGANGQYLIKPEYRCLVPFSAFAEWNAAEKGNACFEVDCEAPMFAGIWQPRTGERLTEAPGKKRQKRQVHDWNLFAFLTTEPIP